MHNEWLSFNHYRTFLFVKFNLKSINSIFSQRFYYSHLGKENPCSSQVKVHKLQDKDKYQLIGGTVEIYIQETGQTIYREIITKKVIEGTVQGKQQKYIYIYIYIYREQDKQERVLQRSYRGNSRNLYIQGIGQTIYIERVLQTIYRGNSTREQLKYLNREQDKQFMEGANRTHNLQREQNKDTLLSGG